MPLPTYTSEAEALVQSTGYIGGRDCKGQFVGYLPLSAANYLVGIGRWLFQQATPWGYVLERVTQPTLQDQERSKA